MPTAKKTAPKKTDKRAAQAARPPAPRSGSKSRPPARPPPAGAPPRASPAPFSPPPALTGFHPLSVWMERLNTAYYQSPETSIHHDFSTYAQSEAGLLTRANARAFHLWARAHPQPRYRVLEVGVGIGAFALGFLQEIKSLDSIHKTKILPRLHYTLADFSKPMLARAAGRISKAKLPAKIASIQLDASSPSLASALGSEPFHLVRCNELFSDLPAELAVSDGPDARAVWLDSKMEPRVAREPIPLSDWERVLVASMPEGYFLPLNRLAARAISDLASLLAPGGWLDLFDYGFYRREDFSIPPSMWNRTVVREYGGQWTVDLNFLYLALALRASGLGGAVEHQKEYAESFMGPLELAEAAPLSGKDASEGLNYRPKKTGPDAPVFEDDFFYHMQVRKPRKEMD